MEMRSIAGEPWSRVMAFLTFVVFRAAAERTGSEKMIVVGMERKEGLEESPC
jgi:hypothetical protein